MKSSIFLYAFVVGVHFVSAHESPPPQIGVLIEYYEVDHAALRPMLREYQSQENASELLKKVEHMANDGDARMVDSAYLMTLSGRRAKIRSIRELLYPTQYDPGFHSKAVGIDSEVPPNPGSFEMRELGLSAEIEPIVNADGKSVNINIAPKMVEFHGYNEWGQEDSRARMPRFYTQDLSAALTMRSGETELLGVHLPWSAKDTDGGGNRVLCFITTMIFTPKISDVAVPLPKRNVSLLTEYIEVDANLASRFARRIAGSTDATTIRRHLIEIIEEGKANILESNLLSSGNDDKAKSKSFQELIYPTEFDPVRNPVKIRGQIDDKLRLTIPAGPTAFEMRPTGCSVEFEPLVSPDGKNVDIQINPEIVRHVKNLTYGAGAGEALQPLFETFDISTALRVEDGKSALIGIHSLETARAAEIATPEEREAVRDRRVLVFITPKITTAGQPDLKKK